MTEAGIPVPTTAAGAPPVQAETTSSSVPAPRRTATCRLSVVMEWANTRLHGVPRARVVLDELVRQWRRVAAGDVPSDLPPEERAFLEALHPRPELVIVSGVPLTPETEAWISDRCSPDVELRVFVAEGLEYYPLKNFGLEQARGDVLLFLDSDVLPDPGWLAHLLGAFGNPDVGAVSGQPYVPPLSLVSRAFALGWTYELKHPGRGLVQRRKFFANNIAFRGRVLRPLGFPPIGTATRGAARRLRSELARQGIPVWQSQGAFVAHPPPTSLRHMVVRGLAHGRDTYMLRSDGMAEIGRRCWSGLRGSLDRAARRWWRGCAACLREGRAVGLRAWQVPAAMAIISAYYLCFAAGGLYMYLRPVDAGRRFRV